MKKLLKISGIAFLFTVIVIVAAFVMFKQQALPAAAAKPQAPQTISNGKYILLKTININNNTRQPSNPIAYLKLNANGSYELLYRDGKKSAGKKRKIANGALSSFKNYLGSLNWQLELSDYRNADEPSYNYRVGIGADGNLCVFEIPQGVGDDEWVRDWDFWVLMKSEAKAEANFAGNWSWMENNNNQDFTIALNQNGNKITGTHTTVARGGARIDDANGKMSIAGVVSDDGKATVKITSGYSDKAGVATIEFINENAIKWKVASFSGEHYFPDEAVMRSAAKTDNGLCAANEEILFAFKMISSPKMMYLCVSKKRLEPNSAPEYIVYRYGTKGSIELEYPNNKAGSWKKFTLERHSPLTESSTSANYQRGQMSWIIFNNGEYQYLVYEHFMDNNKVGIMITNKKTNKETDLKGLWSSRIGSIEVGNWHGNVED